MAGGGVTQHDLEREHGDLLDQLGGFGSNSPCDSCSAVKLLMMRIPEKSSWICQNSKAKNGVDLAEFIKKQDPNAQIIFVTAYDKYAPLTYRRRIGAIDYINKALDSREMMQRLEETLTGAVQSINNLMKSGRKELIYKIGRRVNKVEDTTIYYLENSTSQHKVNLITETGVAEFRSNISKINEENDFLVKVSQSCVVNPNNINSIDFSKKTIKFPNGDEVVFARSCRKTVEDLLNKYPEINVK